MALRANVARAPAAAAAAAPRARRAMVCRAAAEQQPFKVALAGAVASALLGTALIAPEAADAAARSGGRVSARGGFAARRSA
jgi:hypothetical protein